MKSTVQNNIFRDWIRKKWIFVRIQIHFFIFQPYMAEKVPWNTRRNVFKTKNPAEHFAGSSDL